MSRNIDIGSIYPGRTTDWHAAYDDLAEKFLAKDKCIAKLEAEVERLHAMLGMDRPWPLSTALPKLIEAGETLLHTMDYDGVGWEEIDHAIESAKQIVAALNPPAKEMP